MPYQANNTSTRNRKKRQRRIINIHQNIFDKGYISAQADSRRPRDGLSDLTNMEIVMDGVPRPRPPLVAYGVQPTLPVMGRGNMRWNGLRSMLFMLADNGVGKIYKQTDGGTLNLIGGSYDASKWAGFCQSNGRVYVYNGTDKLSYLDLASNTIITYSAITAPNAPTVTKTGLATPSTPYNYYYRITASNAVGETNASAVGTIAVSKLRDNWDASNNVTITWGAVAGATAYTVYMGDSLGNELELTTITGTTFTDDGSLNANPFKLAPEGNATQGPILTWMYNDARNSQIFGVDNNNSLWYAAPGTGDFSPYNGGGNVPIDENGDTVLNFVDGFRNGKGEPVISVSSRGAAGKGKLSHVTFNTTTYGDQVIVYPEVFEANGQSGTYAPRAVIKANDSLIYPTGDAIKSTGTSQNVVNILTTNNISQVIEPDVNNISLENLHKAVGLEVKNRGYFAFPVGSTENNEIWYVDFGRKNMWVLRWPIAAKDMWLYEDSKGQAHHCVLVGNRILEFTRAGNQTTQDDGIPWRSRCAYNSLVWDEDGVILAKIYRQYFKILQPKGQIRANAYGLTKKGRSEAVGDDTFTQSVTATGFGVWDYSGKYKYGDDVGAIKTYGQSIGTLTIKPKGLLNQLDWEVITEGQNCDYLLSAVNTRGTGNENLIFTSRSN